MAYPNLEASNTVVSGYMVLNGRLGLNHKNLLKTIIPLVICSAVLLSD